MKSVSKVSKLKLLEFLNRISLFKTLEPNERKLIADIPKLVVLIEAGDTFIKKGNFDSDFYILLNGEADITVDGQHIAVAQPGHFIGEVGFICNEPRSASVKANTDLIAMRITRDLFDMLPIKVRETVKQKIINGLVDRVSKQNVKIIDLEEKVVELEEKLGPEAESEPESDSHVLDIKPVE